jgi:succinate-semialdehyde dehydrogenase/glutarate-semialdehyde dehydrogenase
VARRLETGSTGVNATLLVYHSFDVPMGGVKASGIGRRHGPHGIRRYVQAQSVVSSVARGGGYESLLVRAEDERWAKALRTAFRLWRHIPGLR